MKLTLNVACISLKSAWQDVCRRFQNQFHRPSPLRSGSLRSALTALILSSLADVLPAADAVATGAAPPEILLPEELAFVRELATTTLKTCGVDPGAIAGDKTNTLGFRAITPGGYPAIWILDFTMNFSSGLIAVRVRPDMVHAF